MKKYTTLSDAAPIISGGGIIVSPTDTIYGILGQALNKQTVERIYNVKKRAPSKPCIILVSDYTDVERFVEVTDTVKKQLNSYWPGPVSVILDCPNESLQYLHRGTFSLAFRMPASSQLRSLIKQAGPLVAPSANPEGLNPAKDVIEAITYFGDSVDGYVEGESSEKPSKIIQFVDDKEVVIRP